MIPVITPEVAVRNVMERVVRQRETPRDRKSTPLNSSHRCISYAVFCLKKKKKNAQITSLREYTSLFLHSTYCRAGSLPSLLLDRLLYLSLASWSVASS